ncbi:response regulator [Novosphingobium cyanobacteriorum]|uniref:Response regulator n=1 Tax=Novosphingobium cyanobacteriorum TaxID=3024215 RepID=A0ABT6CDV4_9SPHN|nr:response regulator [Novosphingobium cyanobacteriorum]MDF8332107.1 response regulator [Novosphingobium cyanobacteriorum]
MRILVVEDEPLLAMLLEENLADLGHEAVGTAATVEQALALLDEAPIDAALLDFSLGHDANSAPIARRLAEEGTPFYYLSGHTSLEAADDAPEAPLLTKPVSLEALKTALSTMQRRAAA